MTDDDGTLDAEFYESLSEQISLSGRSPHSSARPIAMPKTRAVKRDNVTLPLTGEAEQPAQIEILGGDRSSQGAPQRGFTSWLPTCGATGLAEDMMGGVEGCVPGSQVRTRL